MAEDRRLKSIRELLEMVRERVDYAIGRLRSFEDTKALAWRCRKCRHMKKFTRAVPGEVAALCPKCSGVDFDAA